MSQKDPSQESQRHTVLKGAAFKWWFPHPNSHFIQQIHPKVAPNTTCRSGESHPLDPGSNLTSPAKPRHHGTEFINHRRYSSFCDASHNLNQLSGCNKNGGQQDELLVGGWTTPSEKLCSSNWVHFLQIGMNIYKQYLSCHHLELILYSLHSLKLTVRTWK